MPQLIPRPEENAGLFLVYPINLITYFCPAFGHIRGECSLWYRPVNQKAAGFCGKSDMPKWYKGCKRNCLKTEALEGSHSLKEYTGGASFFCALLLASVS